MTTAIPHPADRAALADTAQPEPRHVFEMARKHGVRMVDFKFTDLPGTWQHVSLSIHGLEEEAFEEGLGFDGSSIRGFQEISESDMILIPDPSTAIIDPFHEQRTMSIICNIFDPITKERYPRDPREIAMQAEAYVKSTGLATASWGPGGVLRLRPVAFDQTVNRALRGRLRAGILEPRRGFGNGSMNGSAATSVTLRPQEGYFPAPPATASDLRARMVVVLEEMGIDCEFHHRGLGGWPGGDRSQVRQAAAHGRQAPDLQVRGQERRPRGRQDGHLHAEAAVRGERLRDARPSVAVLGRRQRDVRLQRLWPAVARGAQLHRRPDRTRPRPDGLLRSHHQLLSAAGAGLRSAGQPRVLATHPLRSCRIPSTRPRRRRSGGVPPAGPTANPISPSRR